MKKKLIHIGYVLFVLMLPGTAFVQAQEVSDSLVNVAFGKVAKEDLTGAISVVSISDQQTKNYTVGALDGLNSLIGGYTGNIWGQAPLVLIDGIPRDASTIRASEVESVTIMKGASAVVLYGSRAAKGVVLISTKRGKIQPLHIDVRANTGFYVPKAYPNYLDAATYMTLYNEASRNDGNADRYTQSDIYNTAAGTNPWRYPDIDFYSSDYLKKAYNRSDVTAEVTGGSARARYYANFGVSYNNSLMKYGEQKNNDNLKFNVRANVDMNLTDWLTASADASVVFNENYTGRGDFWGAASTLRPNWFAPLIPVDLIDPNNSALQAMVDNSAHVIDGKYLLGGTSSDLTNNFADMLVAGYIKNKTRNFQFNVNVGADLSMLLPGLSFKTDFAVDYSSFYSEAWRIYYAVYQPTWANMNGKDMIVGLTKYNEDTNSTNEYIGESRYTQTMTFSAQFNYNRTFDKYHNVTAALLGWGYQTQNSADANHNSSDYHRTSNVNLGIQAGYNYRHRYYLDLAGAVVHSAKLPEGKRNAFSPSVTLGWRISDEAFMKENASFVDNLKLTAAYTKLHQDLDISDYYMYKGYYADDAGWYQWHDGTAGGWTTGSRRGDNPNLTFVQREEYRVGLDASLFNKLISLDANFFVQNTNGLLTQGASTIYPSYFNYGNTNYLPYLNYNNDRRTGFDFTLNLKKKIGAVEANLGFSGMVFASKATRRDEVFDDAYQYRAGKTLDAYWGYICEGFFQDQADIDNHARQSLSDVKPGDLKYKDVNGDNVIDSKDQVNLGHNGWAAPPFSYGVNLTLKWNRFTLYALATGNTGGIGMKNSSYYWVRGANKYSDIVLGRWTEETKETATYPRLTTTNNSNNFQNSTFWQYSTDRFDLNKVQLTYDFPQELFKKAFVHSLSLYVSGESLLTISKERRLMELNVGSAPQCRFYNIGFKAAF
ncbi:MAG: SusC/RagA family TonB-linked outer membrane protein [Prevotellaceae bacterium]|jgi:TonB-linked SusC/RagA family outer membrane protein|nr:SusC/RagA family TonB-linked outer membrane protein [Prevotellaceae bacterium]